MLKTLSYSDIFDYPLTLDELHRFLIISANKDELSSCLQKINSVKQKDGYYFISGREEIIQTRKHREAVSQKAYQRAHRYGRILGRLPFIRMVALTGSLAMKNSDETGDYDYMLVASRGRVWTARIFSLILNRVANLFGQTLCPNLIVSETMLAWKEHNLYSAREIAQMVLISGEDTFSNLRVVNKWIVEYFPNLNINEETKLKEKNFLLQMLFEYFLSGKLGNTLEAWEMNRKIKKFSKQAGFGIETNFNAEICQGNFDHHGAWTMGQYQQRLEQLHFDYERENHPLSAQRELRPPEGYRDDMSGVTRELVTVPQVWARSNYNDENLRDGLIMKKILFGQSYYLRFDPKLWDAMMPYPPLGTMYAASYIRERGYDVALFDAMLAESEEEWAESLNKHKPNYAVIFEDNFNYLSKMCLLRMREAAFTMIEIAKQRGCIVILCGADATDHYEEYLNQGADYVLLGEGEETLAELLEQLSAGKARVEQSRNDADLKSILGLAYHEDDRPQTVDDKTVYRLSSIVKNNRRPDITKLDSLPFPAWDLIDVQKYKKLWIERHGYYSMNMVTTRGCPYHCNWCAKPIWGQRYNSRSAENVAQEMKWLKENFAPDHIWFADDIFGLKPNWIEKFAKLLHEMDAVIPFKCLKRADLVNEKTAMALAKAGCKTVWLGAESGSQKILDAMDKGDKVEDIYHAAELLQKHKIEVGFFLQFGYPGETWDDVQKTLKMVRECNPHDIGISVSYPLPGTKFFERVKMELGEKQNWIDSDDLAMLYRGPFPQEFYRILHGRVHHEFRLRKAWRTFELRGILRTPYYLLGVLRNETKLRKLVSA